MTAAGMPRACRGSAAGLPTAAGSRQFRGSLAAVETRPVSGISGFAADRRRVLPRSRNRPLSGVAGGVSVEMPVEASTFVVVGSVSALMSAPLGSWPLDIAADIGLDIGPDIRADIGPDIAPDIRADIGLDIAPDIAGERSR